MPGPAPSPTTYLTIPPRRVPAAPPAPQPAPLTRPFLPRADQGRPAQETDDHGAELDAMRRELGALREEMQRLRDELSVVRALASRRSDAMPYRGVAADED